MSHSGGSPPSDGVHKGGRGVPARPRGANALLCFSVIFFFFACGALFARFFPGTNGAPQNPKAIGSSVVLASGSGVGPPPEPQTAAVASTVEYPPFAPIPIAYREHAQLNSAFLVKERDDDICEAPSGATSSVTASLPPAATALAESSVLPDCPQTNPVDSSEQIRAFATSCNARDGSAWPLLSKKVADRIGLKALKLLLTNRGCDETIEPVSKSLRQELRAVVHYEHRDDLSVLEVGAGCGPMLEFLTEYLMGPTAFEGIEKPRVFAGVGARAVPRFNVLSLDGRESSIRYIAEVVDGRVGQFPASSPHLLDTKAASASSIKFCQADPLRDALTVGLRWSPSETFNLVFIMDQLNDLADAALAAGAACAVVEESVRVLKPGGALWAGHIDRPEVLRALTDCRLATCGGRHKVEMTVVKEPFFFGSPRFLAPKQLLEKKPVGVMWRKIPVDSSAKPRGRGRR